MTKQSEFIALSVPQFQGNEWEYVKDCLDTGWVSSVGSYVDLFEKAVARRTSSRYAVACVNGTSAMHLALLIAGVGKDDEVVVPSLTFVAPANVARYVGAYPVFMDVEVDYWQMDAQKLKDFLYKECIWRNRKLINRHTRRVIKAIVPVHILGHPVDMDPIMELAGHFHLTVIEDVAESIGAAYKNRNLGSIGHMGCFSFNGNKIITCGGGGMFTTNDKEWEKRARYLTTQAKDDPLEYIHHEIGYNFRMTNVQAAIGLAQLQCLDQYITRKKQIASRYQEELKDIQGIRAPQKAPWADSIFWLYTILVDQKKYGLSSRGLLKRMQNSNIQARPLWHPLNTLKPFKSCFAYRIETAPKLYQQALSLPSSVSLSASQQQRVIDHIKRMV